MLLTNKFLQSKILSEFLKKLSTVISRRFMFQKKSSPPYPTQPALDTRQAVPNFERKINKIFNQALMFNGIVLILIISLFSSNQLTAQLRNNQPPPEIILEGASGGYINGNVWNSKNLKHKINLLLYVSPSQQESIENLLERIDSQKFSGDQIAVSLILNTSATWIPNSIIENKVRTKAKEDSTKDYILDKDEIILTKWELSDDFPNIILLNQHGIIVLIHSESITKEITDRLLNQIKSELNSKENLK